MADIVEVNNKDPALTKYIIRFFWFNNEYLTKEFLKFRDMPDIDSIPISTKDYE